MESDSNEELLNEYILSSQLLTDGEPVRCVTSTTSSNNSIELLAGSQGGIVSHITLPTNNTDEPKLEIQPGDSKTRHPYGVVAILSTASLSSTSNTELGSLYATGCKHGIIRIIDGNTHQLKIEMKDFFFSKDSKLKTLNNEIDKSINKQQGPRAPYALHNR